MYYRISNNQNSITKMILTHSPKTAWVEEIDNILIKYNIDKEILIKSKTNKAKDIIREKFQKKFRKDMMEASNKKSKIKYLTEGYIKGTKPNYSNILNRNQTSIIFKARTRMLDFKCNFKNKYKDTVCRLCLTQEETQEHILEKCPKISEKNLNVPKKELFSNNIYVLKDVTKRLEKIEDILDKQK